MTARATFKQADITRALKAVKASGVEGAKVVLDRDGNLNIVLGDTTPPEGPNECDELFASNT